MPKKTTILIQAESRQQSLNVPFVDNFFPKSYKEVTQRRDEVEVLTNLLKQNNPVVLKMNM